MAFLESHVRGGLHGVKQQLLILRMDTTLIVASLMLLVNIALILHHAPAAQADLLLRPERVPPAQFRIRCNVSHSAKDDPLVFPGQPGASHSHDFLGSKAVDAYTTDPINQLVGTDTTCGLKADAAAYWFPSLYQRLANGSYAQVVPNWTLFYYRTAIANPQVIQTIPPGLKMMTGNPRAGNKQDPGRTDVEWWCGALGKHFNSFPVKIACKGEQLIGKLNFPSCWDGVNLDSPDHKSHMYHPALNTSCPLTHPVAIPRISIKVYYPVNPKLVLTWPKNGNGTASKPPVILSTYQSGGTGSPFEFHADFMNGWQPDVLKSLVDNCIKANKKCLVQEDNI